MPSIHRDLDRSLLRGLAWTGGVRWLSQLLSWGGTIVVARLLTPADYGLAGMVAIYTGFTQLLCEAGLTAAMLRERNSDPVARAQLGGVSALLGVVACLLSFLLAAPLAWIFGEPAVREVVRVAGLGFVMRGAQVLPRGTLARDLDFRRLAWIDGLEAIALSVATLTLAAMGAGVWALVIGGLVGSGVGAALAFHWCPGRPRWPSDLRAIAEDVIFGGKVLGSQLAWYAYNNADFAMVGRFLGTQALGTYTLGWTMANVPVDRVSALVNRVTPAYFAALSGHRESLRRYFLSLTEGLAMITFPACLGLALVADDLVLAVLGPVWLGAITPLRILAVIAAVRSIFALGAPILVFTDHEDRNLWFSVLLLVLMPPIFAVATHWGIVAVAGAWVVVYPGMAVIFLFRYALRAVELDWRGYLGALRVPLLASMVMCGAVLFVGPERIGLPAGLPSLIWRVAIGAVTYPLAVLVLAGRRVRQVIDLLRGTAGPESAPAEGSPTDPAPRPRRLLVVSYHFPPDPAVGGLRWQKLARYAVEAGWTVDVIALDAGSGAPQDLSRSADLPPQVQVHRVPAPTLPWASFPVTAWQLLRSVPRRRHRGTGAAATPTSASYPTRGLAWRPFRIGFWRRLYFAWLDVHQGAAWGQAAARAAGTLLAQGGFTAMVSSGPPHPPHEALSRIAKRARVPFVLDLRDPWSLIQRLPEAVASPVWPAIAQGAERRTIAASALVLTTSEAHRDLLRQRHPAQASRIITIRNGTDDDARPLVERSSRFVIAYAGSVYLDRDPTPLFRAAGRLVREEGLTPEEFGMEFLGEVATHDGIPLDRIAEREGVAAHFRAHRPRPRNEALAFLSSASLLVLLPQDSDLAVPAKLFEYVGYRAWLLALATRESATGSLLEGTTADVVAPDGADQIFAVLQRRFREYRRGVTPPLLDEGGRLHRAHQARSLLAALDALAESGHQVPVRSSAGKEASQGLEDEGCGIPMGPDLQTVAPAVPRQEIETGAPAGRRVAIEVKGAR